MIFDRLENISRYVSTVPNYQEIATFLARNDLEELPLGRIEISPRLYANVETYVGRDPSVTLFEGHCRYSDIQIVIAGKERFDFSGETRKDPEVDRERDIYFCSPASFGSFTLEPGFFVLLLPNELHRPALDFNGKPVKKIVFKSLTA